MVILLCKKWRNSVIIRLKLAAGTLYGAIENLLKRKLIKPVKGDDKAEIIYSKNYQLIQYNIIKSHKNYIYILSTVELCI